MEYYDKRRIQTNVQFIWIGCMVLNATFNNLPVISWRSVLLVEEAGIP